MTESREERKARERQELENMMGEFLVKGGSVEKVGTARPNQLNFCLGKLVGINTIPTVGNNPDFKVFHVFVFDSKKTIKILARKQDRAGVEIGKSYSFTYKTHQGMEKIKVPFVTRGKPTELKTSAKVSPSNRPKDPSCG